MIKSLKDLLDKFSRFTNSLVYDGGICKRLNNIVFIQQVNKIIKEILGTGFSSHSFRQGLITEMGSKSINIKIISQFIGHKNISTTMGYMKPTDEQILNNLIR